MTSVSSQPQAVRVKLPLQQLADERNGAALFSGMQQVIFGLAAAALTYGIGRLIGVNLA